MQAPMNEDGHGNNGPPHHPVGLCFPRHPTELASIFKGYQTVDWRWGGETIGSGRGGVSVLSVDSVDSVDSVANGGCAEGYEKNRSPT